MRKLTKLFTWIINNVEKDKLVHKEIGSSIVFLSCIALSLIGIGIYPSVLLSLLITAVFAFGKEYWFDPKYFQGDVPDIKDALWTMMGGIDTILIIIIFNLLY